jgi:hypothetical protein
MMPSPYRPIALSGSYAPDRRILQHSCPLVVTNSVVANSSSQKRKGRCAMARIDFSSLPRENPCAQCGTPIAVPEWVEAEAGRTFYLWRCRACDYRFEAVAYFDSETNREALAA